MFFAQINFEQCLDLFCEHPLPASILLLFTDGLYLFADEEPPFFHFEWVDHVSDENRVTDISLRPSEEPHPDALKLWKSLGWKSRKFPQPPAFQTYNSFFFQKPYRLTESQPEGEYFTTTFNYLDSLIPRDQCFLRVEWGSRRGPRTSTEHRRLSPAWEPAKQVLCLCGIKLGGTPFFYNRPAIERPLETHWKFLFSLCDIGPPFENAPEMDILEYSQQNSLLWFDGFHINFFLDEQTKVQWTVQAS